MQSMHNLEPSEMIRQKRRRVFHFIIELSAFLKWTDRLIRNGISLSQLDYVGSIKDVGKKIPSFMQWKSKASETLLLSYNIHLM